jgi:hypothetical protein
VLADGIWRRIEAEYARMSESLMNESVPVVLRDILSRYGESVADDPRRLEAMLRDLAGDHPLEISLVLSGARAGVPQQLAKVKGRSGSLLVLPQLEKRLRQVTGLSEAAARWSVESWASAMDVVMPDGRSFEVTATYDVPESQHLTASGLSPPRGANAHPRAPRQQLLSGSDPRVHAALGDYFRGRYVPRLSGASEPWVRAALLDYVEELKHQGKWW